MLAVSELMTAAINVPVIVFTHIRALNGITVVLEWSFEEWKALAKLYQSLAQ